MKQWLQWRWFAFQLWTIHARAKWFKWPEDQVTLAEFEAWLKTLHPDAKAVDEYLRFTLLRSPMRPMIRKEPAQ